MHKSDCTDVCICFDDNYLKNQELSKCKDK